MKNEIHIQTETPNRMCIIATDVTTLLQATSGHIMLLIMSLKVQSRVLHHEESSELDAN